MRGRVAVAVVVVLLLGGAWRLFRPQPSAPATATARSTAPAREDGPDTDDEQEPDDEPPALPRAKVTADPGPPDGMGRIDGVVVDRRGKPIRSFTLVARGDVSAKPKSPASDSVDREVNDAHGHFTLDLVPGKAQLVIQAEHYRRAGKTVKLSAGATESVRIELEESNALLGLVRDSRTREPIEGASVEIPRGADTATNGDGRFALYSLPDGLFDVRVSADGYQTLTQGGFRGDRSRDENTIIELEELTADGPKEQFVGAGFTLKGRRGNRGPFVAGVVEGTPAAAVLQAGDDIEDIDGSTVTDSTVDEVRSRIRGDIGTSVRIGIRRDGERLQFDIERARIPIIGSK